MSAINEKTVTMQDVAQFLGVSKATVSLAYTGNGRISPQTREMVLQAARELGFEPNPHAQHLSKGRCANTISLFAVELDLGVGTQKIKAIQHLLAERGYDVPIHSYGSYTAGKLSDQATTIAALCRQKPRAIVCHTDALQSEALAELERYAADGGVLVCHDYKRVGVSSDCVVFDIEHNTYQAARHLLELGHRDLGLFIIGWAERPGGARLQGFERALREFGVTARDEWLFPGAPDQPAEAGGVQLARQFLKMKKRPTGMCIVNDHSALTFMVEVQRAGLRVPQDVSIVGHDDLIVARYSPVPLTTMTHPVEPVAQAVAHLLTSRLDGEYNGPPRNYEIRGELITRESTISR